MARIGRNQPCPCGSGLKHKKCHGRVDGTQSPTIGIRQILEAQHAKEHIRQAQQGFGRPIIATRVKDHQVVAVGNTIYWSKKWKTFSDFLSDYIKRTIGSEWGSSEIGKPFAERHPLMQWYDVYCRYQKQTIKTPGEVHSSEITGSVACYLGVAYALYLLDHNVELQTRLLNRLKDPGNFQGAYYELMVASILIRAGFTLTLEDETDSASKHCEFAAVSRVTGKCYWVEAKMRSVAGLLGRTSADGGPDGKPLSRLIPHLNAALKKPAADERLIFIDVNAEPDLDVDGKPSWLRTALSRLGRYEAKELESNITAYLFVTCFAFHRRLDHHPETFAVPFGLGMSDFNRPGMMRVSEAYRQKQKHIDAYNIGESIERYLRFPITFDGKLSSESLGEPSARVRIGETYFFEGVSEDGTVGTVTAATVNEEERTAYVAITDSKRKALILKTPMSDSDMIEYTDFQDAYFGRVKVGPTRPKDCFELFEWLMETLKDMPRAKLLKRLGNASDFQGLNKLTDSELRMEYCERMVAAVEARSRKRRVNP